MFLAIALDKVFTTPFKGHEMVMKIPEENIVSTLDMNYHPPLEDFDEAVREALEAPFGSKRLCDMVGPSKRVVLLTGYYTFMPWLGIIILDVLEEAGVRKENISILIAAGAHSHERYIGTTYDALFSLLSGRVARIVKNNCDDMRRLRLVGVTSYGNPVWVDRLLAESDVRIGVGDINPGWYGWRGGGKIIIPGVASRDTIGYNHRLCLSYPTVKPGADNDNPLRLDCEEASRLAGLDMKVDLVFNEGRDCVGVFAGDVVKEHRAALPLVKSIWGTEMEEKADIAILYREQEMPCFFRGIYATLLSADMATKEDATIITVLSSSDGLDVDNEEMRMYFSDQCLRIFRMPMEEYMTRLHRWQFPEMDHASIAYPHKTILKKKPTILVNEGISAEEASELGLAYATGSFEEALESAFHERGRDATIVMIPHYCPLPLFS